MQAVVFTRVGRWARAPTHLATDPRVPAT